MAGISTNNLLMQQQNSYYSGLIGSMSGASTTAATATAVATPDISQLVQNVVNQGSQSYSNYKTDITTLNDAAIKSRDSADAISSTKKPIFDGNAVTSEDDSITGKATDDATNATYNVQVDQVATAQKNQSNSYSSSQIGGIKAGQYTMAVKTGDGTEKQISVDIGLTDDNKTALTKIAKELKKNGLDASVKEENNKVSLSFSGNDTGSTKGTVSLRDISGNLTTQANLNNKVQSAQNAKFSVDGVAQEQGSNTAKLDGGNVTLSLTKVTDGKVPVTVGKNTDAAVNSVKDLVSNYNDFISGAQKVHLTNNANSEFNVLIKKLDMNTNLSDSGVTINKNTGELVIDEDKLRTALTKDPKKVENAFNGANGAATDIKNEMNKITTSAPAEYVAPPGASNSNGSKGTSSINYMVSALQASQKGMFLNLFQ